MVSLSDNIKKHRKLNKYTQKTLAEKLGIAPTAVSAWELGRNKPLMDNIEHMATLFGVKISELLGDELAPPLPQVELIPSTLQKITMTSEQLNHDRQQTVLDVATDQWIQQEKERQQKEAEQIIEEKVEELYTVDTVSSLAAGFGFAYDDNDIVTLTVANEPPRHDIASTVRGDSMLPDYEDGDVVYLVDIGFSHYSGQVCAVVVDDETFIKRVYTEPNGLRLVSINPDYPDKFIDFPPLDDTHIKIFKVIDSDKVVERYGE